MNSEHTDRPARQVVFLLFPGFALTSFSLAVEALSVANQQAGRELYRVSLYSAGGTVGAATGGGDLQVVSSNQVPVQAQAPLSMLEQCDILFVCAYRQAGLFEDAPLIARLRSLSRQGCLLAALSGGSFVLARAGLLDGLSCTVAAEQVDSFHELYPDIPLQENIFTVNRNILTCAGGVSALDMLLYVIALDNGREFAHEVSQPFLQDRIRSEQDMQNSNRYLRLRMKSATLGAAIEVMEANLESPCSIELLAKKIGTTPRTLENVFRRYESTTPRRYYLNMRLKRARQMVEETSVPLSVIAMATGFASQSYFTKCFKALFGVPPRALRNPD
ncbi:GlxA family transcriptional regulator [Marinobacterium jannaschii]|uniref:GlxA family transcriptional regulator n=1 Tax=Marinobacterium jannaschii TaxID=64970 RepID=UPI000489150E|nr:GlxA family transcriptional regulator [Marinobacterium jannaschii]